MWKRSEVERLTGLGRHTIQDLCNQNTSRDGLGFWEPAVMKPGYSRFDEGDLLLFGAPAYQGGVHGGRGRSSDFEYDREKQRVC